MPCETAVLVLLLWYVWACLSFLLLCIVFMYYFLLFISVLFFSTALCVLMNEWMNYYVCWWMQVSVTYCCSEIVTTFCLYRCVIVCQFIATTMYSWSLSADNGGSHPYSYLSHSTWMYSYCFLTTAHFLTAVSFFVSQLNRYFCHLWYAMYVRLFQLLHGCAIS